LVSFGVRKVNHPLALIKERSQNDVVPTFSKKQKNRSLYQKITLISESLHPAKNEYCHAFSRHMNKLQNLWTGDLENSIGHYSFR